MGIAQQTEKVRLVHVASGDVHEAWPVDAREHIRAGDYVLASSVVAQTPSAGGEGDGSGDATAGDSSSAAESSAPADKKKKA